jgi:nicotinate-nucleotide--dimethylbenzimidazole phosphoribosyltransferase
VSLRVVDVAVDHSPDAPAPDSPLAPDPRYRVGAGTGRIDRTDALTEEETERALAVGRALVDEEVDGGADLLVPGAIGVGATTPASVLVAAVTGAEPVAVVGRGSGIDDETWMRKAAAIRDALRRARPHARDPLALLRVAGGADIAVLTGFLVQAAVRRTPVLLDGLVPVTAALIADEWAPGARDWWLLAQRSPEPALALAAEHLELTPVLDLQVRLDDGSGAVAAVPLLAMAARLLAETGTAADTGITPIAHAGV